MFSSGGREPATFSFGVRLFYSEVIMKQIQFVVTVLVDDDAEEAHWRDYVEEAVNNYMGEASEEGGEDLIDFEPAETKVRIVKP